MRITTSAYEAVGAMKPCFELQDGVLLCKSATRLYKIGGRNDAAVRIHHQNWIEIHGEAMEEKLMKSEKGRFSWTKKFELILLRNVGMNDAHLAAYG